MTSTKTKLTPKRAEFVSQYMVDLNATKAAKRAGYSARTAQRIGSELLCFPLVAAAIEAAKAERSRRTEITADRVLAELARIAFADPRKLFDTNGAIKPLDQIDDDTRAALVIEVTQGGDAEGTPTFTRKTKMMCKLAALEKLGKHLGLFRDRLEVSGDAENPLHILIQKIQGSALPIAHEDQSEDAEHRRVA